MSKYGGEFIRYWSLYLSAIDNIEALAELATLAEERCK